MGTQGPDVSGITSEDEHWLRRVTLTRQLSMMAMRNTMRGVRCPSATDRVGDLESCCGRASNPSRSMQSFYLTGIEVARSVSSRCRTDETVANERVDRFSRSYA